MPFGAGWLAFLRSLTARGLRGVQLVVSDAHAGLVNAIGAGMTRGAHLCSSLMISETNGRVRQHGWSPAFQASPYASPPSSNPAVPAVASASHARKAGTSASGSPISIVTASP